ncbi:MAG: hypothetical protein ACREMW_13870 [Gemmatimonadales bacterium]
MTFKPSTWLPIAVVVTVINVLGAGYAVGTAEPAHAAAHVVLGLVFGLWAYRLRQGTSESAASAGGELEAGIEALEFEVSDLRRELSEMQERLDFAERVLAQKPESRRVDPKR